MSRFHLAAALAVALAGCAPAPATSAPQPPVASSVLFASSWQWPPQTHDSPQLARELEQLDTPEAIARHLEANYSWAADYDGTRFLTPNETAARRRGLCTAFARYWLRALERIGIKGEFIAFWAPTGAHAVCIFEYPAGSGVWRLASNQYLYERPLADGPGARVAAIARAAGEFYPGQWSQVQVFRGADGGIWQRLMVETAAGADIPQAPAPAPAGSAWNIKR